MHGITYCDVELNGVIGDKKNTSMSGLCCLNNLNKTDLHQRLIGLD